MSKPCTDHMKFPTAAAAEAYRQELIARAKCTGENGTSWKRLVVFRSRSHFHVGTNRKTFIQTEPPQSVLPDVDEESMGDWNQIKRAFVLQ